jgi:periplasmic protein TonB
MTSAIDHADLFAAPPSRRRSWTAVVTSAALHVAVLMSFALLAARIASTPAVPREYRPITFVMIAPLPIPHEPTPALKLSPAITRPEPERPAPLELVKAEPLPAPKPIAHSEPGAAPPEPVRPSLLDVAPTPTPVRPRPPVTVGLFADKAPTVLEAEPAAKTVTTVGFDTVSPTTKTGETKSPAVVGAFDSVAPGPPAKGTRQGSVIASTGFGSAAADPGVTRKTAAEVKPSGFDAVQPAAPPVRLAPLAERVDVPVEIVFKPTPVYTSEARALKLEGEVLLDVEFAASGSVSVLQVVRGLGHGLDEAAASAAKQIRFKPAQSAGRPINFRTTVHIVFRLA